MIIDFFPHLIRSNILTGSIQLNGSNRDLASFRRSSAYIMQDDNLQELLTVQENMSIAADLKLDASTVNKQRVVIICFHIFILVFPLELLEIDRLV